MARMDRYKNKPQEPEKVYRAMFPPEPEEAETPAPRHAAGEESPPRHAAGEEWRASAEEEWCPPNEEEPRVYLPPRYRAEEQNDFQPDDIPLQYGAPVGMGYYAAQEPPRDKHGGAMWAVIAFVCLGLLSLMGYYVYTARQAYAPFRRMVAATERKTFAQGVWVDDVDISGLTRAEAEQRLKSVPSATGADLRITIDVDGQIWYLTRNELPFERNLSNVLDMAYAVGRQGSKETLSSGMTPLEYRWAHLSYAATNPVRLYTAVTYDKARVRELAGIVKANIDREPADAMVSTFDFSSRAFTFTDEVQGAELDGDELERLLISALERGDYQAKITMESQKKTPRVTKAALMSSFTLVSTYSTETTSSANRNTNIDLAARAVTGTVVMPGETFSFNQTTGQRTTEKGYLPAAAIAGGTTVDEVGGGVCQVSSTIFNAAAMADLTILTRYPHTWPSTYVDKGRDATVNWPNLDFAFRNDRQTPIFIVSYYQNRRVTVELYGAALEPGLTIGLVTRTVSETPPPDEPIYENNPSLPAGTVQEKKKARTGYEVETYKVYKKNGVEIKREWLCDSSYKMIQQVIEYN